MDEAAVSTIHGFCQRVLNLSAFRSGTLFEQQLIEGESLLRHRVCADFWCRHCYPSTREIVQVIFEIWKGPRALLHDINRCLQGKAPATKAPPFDDKTLASRHAQIVARTDAVKQQWRDAAGELDALIESSGIDRYKFNCSNRAKWIDRISAWAEEGTNSCQLPEPLEKFSQHSLEDRMKAGEEAS